MKQQQNEPKKEEKNKQMQKKTEMQKNETKALCDLIHSRMTVSR